VSKVFEVRIIVDRPRFQLDVRDSDELLRIDGMAAVEDELKRGGASARADVMCWHDG